MLSVRPFAVAIALVSATPALAVPITYSGFDAGSTSLASSPNAANAASDFDASVSSAEIDTFASPVNPDFSRTNGTHSALAPCNNTYAYNTTPGGGHFICDNLGYGVSFTFGSNAINAFGLYLTSYQGTDSRVRVRYSDGSFEFLALANVGSEERGTYFFGFEDIDAQISSIAFEPVSGRYSFGYDDLRYRFAPDTTDPGDPIDPPPQASVPEPGSIALFALGLLGLATSTRRRS